MFIIFRMIKNDLISNIVSCKHKSLVWYVLILSFSFSSSHSTKKPYEILSSLSQDNGWKYVSTQNNINLSTKDINQGNTLAVKVQKETDIPHEVIVNILMDIKNYGSYFKSSKSLNFSEVRREKNSVEGHHYIPVNIPFIKNREYYFRMHPNNYQIKQTNTFLHWYLIENNFSMDKQPDWNFSTSIYLDVGAGVWNKEELANGNYLLSYRLILNPGGSLPDALIDRLNKVSVVNIFDDIIHEAERRVSMGFQKTLN